jgi:hypothetical protein
MRFNLACLLAALLLLPFMATAQPADFSDAESQRALAAGEIPVHAATLQGEAGGRVRAAVIIHARPETVWQIMRDCASAPAYVPGVRRCQRVDAAADGSWEIVEHEMKYSWLMPVIRSVLLLEYHTWQMDFRRLSGDLKAEEGSWRVQRTDDDDTTLVEYQLHVDPGFWVPGSIVRASLRHALPEALQALRKRAEAMETSVASADGLR